VNGPADPAPACRSGNHRRATSMPVPNNASPEDSPCSTSRDVEQYVWEMLVPRLVSPFKVAIIEALVWLNRPLAPALIRELFPEDLKLELVRYHAQYLANEGVLEIVVPSPQDAGDSNEPAYFLAKPQREDSCPAPAIHE
jgi:hypothetical protein